MWNPGNNEELLRAQMDAQLSKQRRRIGQNGWRLAAGAFTALQYVAAIAFTLPDVLAFSGNGVPSAASLGEAVWYGLLTALVLGAPAVLLSVLCLVLIARKYMEGQRTFFLFCGFAAAGLSLCLTVVYFLVR